MKLKLDNLDKFYDKQILFDLNIEIFDVKAVAVIGPSGCGKSTLLRLLAGLEEVHNGDIFINQFHITGDKLKEYQKHIGFVFQTHNLFPHLSLLRNITLILEKTRGYSQEEANIRGEELLRLLHLEDQKEKLPGNVSGGQSQRASIARALSTNPDILLLDEPTASLDPILTHEVLNAVKELKSLGRDFIFVTHEIDFVKSFADYFIFMDEGKIIEHGPIANLSSSQKIHSKSLGNFMKKVSYD